MPSDNATNSAERFTPQAIRDAVGELTALVDQRLPERFWPSEAAWRAVLTALVARMTALLESLAALADPPRQPDALILVRALYEHLITFAWLAIDPKPRVDEYLGHSMVQGRRVLGTTHQGPVPRPCVRPKNILTLRGLYVAIYRQASRQAHAAMESPDECIVEDGTRHLVLREPKGDELTWSAFAVPLFAIALVIAHERLGWPDEVRVREINHAFAEVAGAIPDKDDPKLM